MTVANDPLMAFVLRTREHDGFILVHAMILNPIRAIDVKEGHWEGVLIGRQSRPIRFSVYGEGTSSYADEDGKRIVMIAGEIIDEEDIGSLVLEHVRNEFLFKTSTAISEWEHPCLLAADTAGSLITHRIRVAVTLRDLSQAPDFLSHLAWEKWFCEMHDKFLPMRKGSYSALWGNHIAAARQLKPASGHIFPIGLRNCRPPVRGVLRLLDPVGRHYFNALVHLTPAFMVSRGMELYREVYWHHDDQEEHHSAHIGTIVEVYPPASER